MNINQYLPKDDMYEDLKLISEIDHKVELNSLRTKTNHLIDDDLALGVNWYDPSQADFVDPTQDSPTRFIIVLLVNKFKKKMFVLHNRQTNGINIPSGRPKILEPIEYAATRLFRQLTSVKLEPDKLHRLETKWVNPENQVSVFLTFDYSGDLPLPLRQSPHWRPLAELRYHRNPAFQRFFDNLYYKILQMLY